MMPTVRRALTSCATLAAYGVLVVPFALGWFETSLMTPLALPGYLLYVIGTAIGNAIAPAYKLWVYWLPFLAGSYGLAVAVGYGYAVWRDRSGAGSAADARP
ncbi:hypothetical protein [Natrinema salaciae]|uniref:Uncharacterized protein n=1 Tax=Natrinema salaciae TaxID=1186196 RepID=A0A1H9B823_9EURY|nr:hypothetical protein [Natrinema salaciae]SEP84887.1 hypothetical protein SAMN04489841_0657 [Natrinema salaciae]